VEASSWNLSRLCPYSPDTMLAIAPPPCGAMKVGRMAPAACGGTAAGAAGIAIVLAVVAIQTLEKNEDNW
jgi:hypothetical protein